MAQKNIDQESWRPILISSKEELEKLSRDHSELKVIDQYETNLKELFFLRNPKYRFDKNYQANFEAFKKEHFRGGGSEKAGSWFYFPWLNSLIHFLPEAMHQELRTGRNKHLITQKEQEEYYRAIIGILGMSVGSHIALTIAMTGGAKQIKIADPDVLSGDNINRIRAGFQNVGLPKVVMVARQIYEFNPYANVEVFESGLTEENIDEFLEDLSVLVEEMDHPYLKLKVRDEARKRGIPVVMGTDNGDGIIVDIERFDTNKQYPIFHGLIGKMTAEDLKNLPPKDLPKVAAKIAGANLAVPKMLHSVTEVGKSLYSWPQLGTAANLCGSVVSYLARRIIVGDTNIKSGRYQVNLDSIFESDYKKKKLYRKKVFFKFIKVMMDREKKGGTVPPPPQHPFQKVLDLAVYAPSGDNSQPWRFEIEGNRINIFNLPDKDNPILNFNQGGSYIAHGGLIENITISAPSFGYRPIVRLFPDPGQANLVAEVTLQDGEVRHDPLLKFVKERTTNRKPYKLEPLTDQQKEIILRSPIEVGANDVEVRLVEDKLKQKEAAAAGSSIEQVILENKELHSLLFKDVRWSAKEEREKKSGLHIDTMEFKPPQKFMFRRASNWSFMKLAIKLGLPKFIAKDDAKLYGTGSAFGALVLKNDSPEDFVNAGRVMQRVWLKATETGLSLQPVTALAFAILRVNANKAEMISETHQKMIRDNYKKLENSFGVTDRMITMPFRIGYADPPSARSSRKTPDILIK